MKFGSAKSFRHRIFKNYLVGFGGNQDSTTQRIHGYLILNGMIEQVEISWHQALDEQDARKQERELRDSYKQRNHGKRPKWDLNG